MEYKGYVAEQAANFHVHVSRDGRTCLHASADHRLTKAELREMIELCLRLQEHPEELNALPDVEKI